VPKTKTREDLLNECAGAVRSCFNHYSDEPIGEREQKAIARALGKLLPLEVPMAGYDKRVAEYEAEHAEELAAKERCERAGRNTVPQER